ncbi:MAG: heparinase II/III family protein [Tepidisphaeraceae bacterium]
MTRCLAAILSLVIAFSTTALRAEPPAPRTSAFYPPALLQRVRANIERDDWGRGIRRQAIELAEPWKNMSDEQVWKLMFGANLPRSWMVWSNGNCPACAKPVPMYDWRIDAINFPWKLRCPHVECAQLFPKNDFARFHESGLDAHGIFDPAKADRSLLFNAEHPDKSDPLHSFGVDDGNGYVNSDGQRWRFIPAYLVYGQWKQYVQRGIRCLATAYVVTGEPVYAHKAAILLDRVADVYPSFDFKTQGILYESVRADGYVSVWHDATIETREMVLAYDAIRDAIDKDAELVKFLVEKSAKFDTPTKKASGADIRGNIETRILRDAIANRHKIYSNYPQEFLTKAVIMTALDWPNNRAEVFAMLDPVIEQTTAVDGTTGEKGLAGYSAYAAQRFAEFLGYYARMDDKFLPEMIQRHPRLPQMWRFFIDAWCADNKYYPSSGDTGWFAGPQDYYAGVSFLEDQGVGAAGHMSGVAVPSMYSFLFSLYGATKDPAFAQVLYHRNKHKLDGLPFDLFQPDPETFKRELKSVIDEHGPDIKQSSANKTQWHLALLKSGRGDKSRAAWLDYDAWGGHGHADGMNLGLFAKGLDLMPDFGYPPVQFGGWESDRANWYKSTFAHNTVVVNGAQQPGGAAPGTTNLWAAGKGFSAISVNAPGLNPNVTTRFERTAALVDVSDDDAYLLDIFRVAGGSDHVKFYTAHFGALSPLGGLALAPATDFTHPQMRNVQASRKPQPGWSIELKVEDRYNLSNVLKNMRTNQTPQSASDVRVRYTDFTTGADAYTCEGWVIAGTFNSTAQAWVPRIMTRRPGGESTFVTIVEPFTGERPLIAKATRLPLAQDSSVALLLELTDGRSDVLVSNDTGGAVTLAELGLTTDAKLCLVRRDAQQRPMMIVLCGGRTLQVGKVNVELPKAMDFAQFRVGEDGTLAPIAKP